MISLSLCLYLMLTDLVFFLAGHPQELWQLHHVSLDVKTKFRVVFQGTKGGSGSAAGGLSLDDINLSETSCPEFIWRVKNFSHLMENTPTNKSIFSPPFTSKQGYTFQMQLYPNGVEGYPNELSAYSHLVAREGDTGQTWPCPWKQMTMMLMDQHPHIQKRMSNQRSVTTDPTMKASGATIDPIRENFLSTCFLVRSYLFCLSLCRLRPVFLGRSSNSWRGGHRHGWIQVLQRAGRWYRCVPHPSQGQKQGFH